MRVQLCESQNAGGKTTVTLEQLADGSLQIFYYDLGEDARRAFGDDDYEAWVTVPADQLSKLAFVLLAERYNGVHDAMSDLRTFCDRHKITTDTGVWT